MSRVEKIIKRWQRRYARKGYGRITARRRRLVLQHFVKRLPKLLRKQLKRRRISSIRSKAQ